jgi:hypothetical protein
VGPLWNCSACSVITSAQRTARGELRCREARVLGSGCGCGFTEIMNELIAELLGL